MSLISQEQLEDRMDAIREETIVEKVNVPEMTARGKMLYEKFCLLRINNARANYEEDVKIRDLFIKLGKEQAEKAEAELYNKESEGEILNTMIEDQKSGLQEAFEDMLQVKEALEPLYTKDEIRDAIRDVMALKTPLTEEEVKQLQDEEDARRLAILNKENGKF